ncbi:tetratricopeptide repeat protein [Sulfuriferula nivalis]|uniref:Methyltransferase type 11 domain-containing protein n=1 Tax=Sulfuriferula nivalis TaxID=2675298 RepID=A0A809SHE2_9PROT|nr:tetratricopeptide repeat protein [Sulfuriferula nivalis]BBP00730.1 hypothetical protein SFSGTM_14380 [Sulfuriferula nivalis]
MMNSLYTQALRHHQNGDLVTAEQLYREIILTAPENPDAMHYLGFLLQQTDRLAEAFEQITAAIALDNTHAEWYFNLGIVLSRQGLFEPAIDAYTSAITLDRDKYFYWTNLGAAFEANQELDKAEHCYIVATKIDPNCPDAFYLLSVLYLGQERYSEARHNNHCGIIVDPTKVNSRIVLGQAYYELGRAEEAIAVFETWLRAEPDNPVATHMLNAYRGQQAQPQCTSQYIEQTFDTFANSFENVLGRLRYCGPQLVQEHIASYYPPSKNLNVLDLGCGTGLVGTVLQPYAHRLTGVDLSQAMLNQAATKQIYHQLHKADITAYLASTDEQFDLITCMDTLIYLGHLDEIFALIHRRLKPDGMLIVSTEKLAVVNDLGYKLNISGRYSHHADYLVSSLTKTGFQIDYIRDVPIRTEAGCQIDGQFICASPYTKGELSSN